ncbi:hypothetical protein CC78DRAFT_580769 [Lojkania enalia]|uniref:Uncharacterized protein n=1 Tax=Lojkania enalia TaxID=147567 RepID=A0A9P4N330_9PLEO|nr:hypothetical protein CC78DRAFT_580769 [Didymosphaeria enalia]
MPYRTHPWPVGARTAGYPAENPEGGGVKVEQKGSGPAERPAAKPPVEWRPFAAFCIWPVRAAHKLSILIPRRAWPAIVCTASVVISTLRLARPNKERASPPTRHSRPPPGPGVQGSPPCGQNSSTAGLSFLDTLPTNPSTLCANLRDDTTPRRRQTGSPS